MPFLNAGELKHATHFSSQQNLYQRTKAELQSFQKQSSSQINTSFSQKQQFNSQNDVQLDKILILKTRHLSFSHFYLFFKLLSWDDRDVQKITKSINNTDRTLKNHDN